MASEVTCPNCRGLNDPANAFCTSCGVRLRDIAGEAGLEEPAQAFQEELSLLRGQVRDAGVLLDQLQDRISQLELAVSTSTAPVQRRDVSQPEAAAQTLMSAPQAGPEVMAEQPASISRGPSQPLSAPQAGPAPAAAGEGSGGVLDWLVKPGFSVDWENVLGRNWLAIIGAVTLVLGIGFFLKLAFDNNWIGDTGRVALGAVVGIVLLGTGEYARRRIPVWAQPVTAGGAAILYLSIYAAFGLYQLIRPEPAFLLLALVVAIAGFLALRYESLVIALLGILGAFLSPVLLGPDLPDVRLVLVYILVVDLGILGVSTFRSWRWFNLLGWAGSYGLFIYWLELFPDFEPALVQAALTGVFLVFAGATTLFHVLWRRVPGLTDLGLVAANAAVFFGLTVGVLWGDYEDWFGLIAFALSVFYGLITFAALRRTDAPPQVSLVALPTAIVFLTVAIPLQFSGLWVAVAWAAQGAVLIWTGFLLSRWDMRSFALGALALAVLHLLLFDAWVEPEGFVLVLNERFPVFVVAIAAFYVGGFLYWRNRGATENWEAYLTPALLAIANLLTVLLFSLEAVGYFAGQAVDSGESLELGGYLNPLLLTVTAVWAIYGAIVLGVGLARRIPLVRWGGLALLGLAVFKLLAVDTFFVQLDPYDLVPFINIHFLTMLVVTVLLAGFSYWTWRERSSLAGWEAYAFHALLVAANLVAVWAVSLEVVNYFDGREVVLGVDNFSAKHLTLTVLWAVYAVGVIAVGIAKRSSKIRLAGIALLAVPVVKLFVFDVFLLEREYRVAAFVTLGVLLLGTGLAYQRYSRALRGFLFGQTA